MTISHYFRYFSWLLFVALAFPVSSDDQPIFLTSITTPFEYESISVTGDPFTNVIRAAKFITPASDDPELLDTVFQNVNLFPWHPEFMSAVFPERFAGMTLQEYFALTQFRATRQYYTGGLNLYDDGSGGLVYGFDVYTAGSDDELLSVDETRALYSQLAEKFTLLPFAYSPVRRKEQEAARLWPDPGFPVFFPNDVNPLPPYIPYTQASNYGRIRLLIADELADTEGSLSWQDIVVLDDAPVDIEGVVAGVITAEPQGELSHITIRTARRGTPNAYVENAHEEFAQYEGQLVRLTVGPLGLDVETGVTVEEADIWWDAHRPLLVNIPRPDPGYATLDGLLEMDVLEEHGALAGKFGGKAANLAKMYSFLPAENQVSGFAIPFRYYLDFLQENTILDQREDPPVERSFVDYLQHLNDDPRFQSDAIFRAEQLEDFRDYLREYGVVEPALVSALIERIDQVFGSTGTMVRFRSSSNVEDSLVFNGAGLYDSTSVCADDTLDGDTSGPSHCWFEQNKERTIERGLKKVWASLWNFRAWEERSYFQVPQDRVAMAILVNTAFPDEAANGVAFTGDPNAPRESDFSDWALYVVNVQDGDASVVSPEPGVLSEKDILVMFDGEVRNVVRARRSSLLPFGEWVLSDDQLHELGAAMGLVADRMPIDLEGHLRSDVLFDIEFKITQQQQLIFKQVRSFLRSDVPQPNVDDFFSLEVPADTTLCGVFSEGRSPRQEYDLLTQIDLVPGLIHLAKDRQVFEADMIAELRLTPEQIIAEPLGRGIFERLDKTNSYRFEQKFQADSVVLSLSIDGLIFDEQHSSLVLDEAVITHSLSVWASVGEDGAISENLQFSSCSYRQLPLWRIRAELEDGASVSLDLRYQPADAGSGPANLVHGEARFDDGEVTQTDYWKLVYATEHHNFLEKFWLLFDEPRGAIHGVAIIESESKVFSAFYLGADLEVIDEPRLISISREPVTPPLDEGLPYLSVVPAVAHTPGAEGTNWLSNVVLQVALGTTAESEAHLYFLHREQGNFWTYGQTVILEPNRSVTLADVVRDTFGIVEGAGALLVSSETPVVVSSRTYNDAAAGTYGQYIPGVALIDAVPGTSPAWLIQLTGNESFRSNLGYVNLGSNELELVTRLLDAEGTLIDTWTQVLGAYGSAQDNAVFGRVGALVGDGRAVVQATDPDAQYVVYSSVVDQVSGDPVYSAPVVPSSGSVYIPAVAHVDGSLDTRWRSDVVLFNNSDDGVEVRLDWLPRGSDNSQPASEMISLSAAQTVRLDDVVGELLATNGTGGLRVTSDGAVAVSSRTYNDLDGMTFGQGVPALAESEALAEGDRGLLVQLAHSREASIGFRTNIGFLNITEVVTAVEIDLFSGDGIWLGSLSTELQPFAFDQSNNVFDRFGAETMTDAYAVVHSESLGALFFTYASVVDNRSGDPVFQPARAVAAAP